jgi:hypothetical protein
MLYNTIYKATSKPRLNLLLNILQRPFAPRLLTPHLIDLRLGEALGLHSRVVAQTVALPDLLVGDGLRELAVGALVDGHHDGAAEAEVVLQAGVCALD